MANSSFQIKRGLSTNLFDEQGQCKIPLENGCWYLTTDTAEIYVALDIEGILHLKKINDNEIESFDPIIFLDSTSELEHMQRSEGIVYIIRNENATYRWSETDLEFVCIGRDYTEVELIDGGNALGH